jgi:DNA-binding FadR family transcriptional regulator
MIGSSVRHCSTAALLSRSHTQILSAIEKGDPQAAGELFRLVYDGLRILAAR